MDRAGLTHEKRTLESQIADLQFVLNGDTDPELSPQLEAAEKRMAEIDSELAKPLTCPPFIRQAPAKPNADAVMKAFLSGGTSLFTSDDAKVLQRRGIPVGVSEIRTGLMTSVPTGSYAREESSLLPSFEAKLREYSDYFAHCRVISTQTGETLRIAADDDDQAGVLIPEAQADLEQDCVLQLRTIDSFVFSSSICLLSAELVRDQRVGLEAMVAEALAGRINKITGQKFTLGTGTGEPLGLLSCVENATIGGAKIPAVTTAGAGAITMNDLVQAFAELPPTIQAASSTRWFMSPQCYQSYLRFSDSTGRPMAFHHETSAMNAPLGTLCGKAISILPDLENVATGKVCAVVGDPKSMVVRLVHGIDLQRNESLYWKNRQIGVRAVLRGGFGVISGSNLRAVRVR